MAQTAAHCATIHETEAKTFINGRESSITNEEIDHQASPTTPPTECERLSVQRGTNYGSLLSDREDDRSIAKNKSGSDETISWTNELRALCKNSLPLILTLTLQISFNLITVWVCGRLGVKELGAASLANMTANVTGFCVYEGLATSLDTLTSQAYGAGKKHLVGLYVQRMCVLSLVATIPIGIIWICSPIILAVLIPQQDLAIMAGTYLRILLIGAPGWATFEAGRRFTQAQGQFNASMWVTLGCMPICILLNWLMVFKLQMGIDGAALALALTYTAQPLGLVLYVIFVCPSTLACWPGLQWRETVQDWGPMVRLAIPGVVMTLCEWLAFEVLTFSCSYLGPAELAAQSVVLTVILFTYHAIPYPVSIACCVRFGNLIGGGSYQAACSLWKLYYLLFILIGLFDMTILASLQHEIAALFTDDLQVRSIISGVLPIVAAAQFTDALLTISCGLLRGLGRQKMGSWINLCVYYGIAVPCSLALTFGPPRLGLTGLWIGPCLGVALGSISIALYMSRTDWRKTLEEA